MNAGCSATGCSATPTGMAAGSCSWSTWASRQLLWFKRVRQNLKLVFVIGVLINIGMWFERFVIIVGSLYQDFLPANWGVYYPTWVDIGTYLGTLGAFFMMYLLFIKFLPMIAIAEVKGVAAAGRSASSARRRERRQIMSDEILRPHGGIRFARGDSARRRKKSATPATAAGTCSRRSRFTAWTR